MSATDHMSAADDASSADGEGVWSPEIEASFQEALLLFPPCGRRKHILQEEGGGKMYGRNELISRHIFLQTGKHRTRKQVSSHIQVLARRRARVDAYVGSSGSATPSPSSIRTTTSSDSMPLTTSSTQPQFGKHNNPSAKRSEQHNYHLSLNLNLGNHHRQQSSLGAAYYDQWLDRPIATHRIRLVEFSAFIEHRLAAPAQHTPFQRQAPPASAASVPMEAIVAPPSAYYPPIHNYPAAAAAAAAAADLGSQQAAAIYGTHNPSSNIHAIDHFAGQHYHSTSSINNQQHLHQNQINGANGNHLGTIEHEFSAGSGSHLSRLLQQNHPTSNGHNLARHHYIRVDYANQKQHEATSSNKLESIDIGQIQDKFPDICGADGLFSRCPQDGFYLVKFWADISSDYEYNIIDDQNSYFGYSSHFETIELHKNLICSTKACSYGQQVVEKVDRIQAKFNESNGRYSYALDRSPMCEFMIQFIKKLRQLPKTQQMNSVLENFTVLQVITSSDESATTNNTATSGEVLLCLAYVFEVEASAHSPTTAANHHIRGPQHHVYKLTKD